MNIKEKIKKIYRYIMRYIPNEMSMKIDYLRGYRKILNLENPDTFGAKIQWIKLFGGLDRYADFVDKYKVRGYIEEKIGQQYLPQLYGLYEKSSQIDFEKLPNKFVLKCNHGCGYNLICNNKDEINIDKWKRQLDKWLSEDFSKEAKEIQYKNIKPVIVCEEFLEEKIGNLIDYKYFCFDGKPEFIQVIGDRGIDIRANFYTMDWETIELKSKLKNSEKDFDKPKNLEKMNELARKLSEDFHFVRVDFYNIDGRIVFGELTFTPGGGVSRFTPIEKDYEIASKIDLSKYVENN